MNRFHRFAARAVVATVTVVAACRHSDVAAPPSQSNVGATRVGNAAQTTTCSAACPLITSSLPLRLARFRQDSVNVDIPVALLRLAGQPRDSVRVSFVTDSATRAALGPSVQLRVRIGLSEQLLALQSLSLPTTVYSYSNAATIDIEYSLTRTAGVVTRTAAASLNQLTTAGVSIVSDQRRWAAISDLSGSSVIAFESGSVPVVAPGTYGGVAVGITPFAEGDPFGDFQSDLGTGASQTISVTFNPGVDGVTVTVQDPTFDGNQIVAYNNFGAEIARVTVPGSFAPGLNVPVTRSIAGQIARIELIAAANDYVAYSDFSFVPPGQGPPPGSCGAASTVYKQGAPSPWAADILDHTNPPRTIGQRGCALTSLAMALNGAGVPLDPGSANAQLTAAPTVQFIQGGMIWPINTLQLSNGALQFDAFTADTAKMHRAVCASMPVVVGVKLAPPNSRAVPGHFVLVTRYRPDSGFMIQDPATGTVRQLSTAYPDFVIRGAIRPRGASIPSTLPQLRRPMNPFGFGAVILASPEEFGVSAAATIDIADAQGRHTIASAATAPTTNIPSSFAMVDKLDDDETGDTATIAISHVIVKTGIAGTYHVVVTPQAASTDSVATYMLSTVAGTPVVVVLPYNVSAGIPLVFDFSVKIDGTNTVTSSATGFVTLTYICGNKFRLRNTNGLPQKLRWDVYNTSDQGLVDIPGRTAGTPYAEVFFATTLTGTVRVFGGTTLIQTKANGNKAC